MARSSQGIAYTASIEGDVEVLKALGRLHPGIGARVAKAVDAEAFVIQREVRRDFSGRKLQSRSGRLRSSVGVGLRGQKMRRQAIVGSNLPYANVDKRRRIHGKGRARAVIVGRANGAIVMGQSKGAKGLMIPDEVVQTAAGVMRADTIDKAALLTAGGADFHTFFLGRGLYMAIRGTATLTKIGWFVGSVLYPGFPVWKPATKRARKRLSRRVKQGVKQELKKQFRGTLKRSAFRKGIAGAF